MSQTTAGDFHFGRVVVRPAQREVLVDGRAATLGARALDVLLVLLAHGERVVTKDELLERAWPGLVVEENNLQVQISALRKLLGAHAIATIPGRGYQFTLAPTSASGGDAPAPMRAPRHNLPPQLTTFVGREDDLADLQVLLRQTRMLTLTGIGGCGKTRLALRLAEAALPSFADGVRYVDLAPLQEAERLALRVATAFGLGEDGATSIEELLCGHLRDQQLLLVLDNCEHLGSAPAALVTTLLAAAPRVVVLATSREGLGVPGERMVQARSLTFPPGGKESSLAEVQRYEAVQLFVDRARSIAPHFAVTDESAAVLAEICRRLDGIPLAIELAAARIKVLSVQEIRARLDDRFRLLTGGSRIAVGRQQTLLATMQWSHDQLTEDERKVLRRLSVFAGGWTLKAAVTVTGERADEYTMLDVLSGLASHSLITAQSSAAGATRYGMLETVRLYAQERLSDAGEVIATRDRHLDYFLAFAEAADRELRKRDQISWLTRVDDDLENLLVAHAWCDQTPERAQHGLRLVAALRGYLSENGLYLLGESLASQALQRAGAQAPDLARCRALATRAFHVFFLGRYQQSMADARASKAIADEIDNDEQAAFALWIIGFDELASGRLREARAAFERVIDLARSPPGTEEKNHLLTRVLIGLAEVSRTEGDLDRALQLNEEVLSRHRDDGDRSGMVIALGNLAMTALGLAQVARAVSYLRHGVELADTLGRDRNRPAQLFCAAGLAVARRDWERAARFVGAMQAACVPMNYHIEPADVPFVDSVIATTLEALGAEAFAQATSAGRALSVGEATAELRDWLGAI